MLHMHLCYLLSLVKTWYCRWSKYYVCQDEFPETLQETLQQKRPDILLMQNVACKWKMLIFCYAFQVNNWRSYIKIGKFSLKEG